LQQSFSGVVFSGKYQKKMWFVPWCSTKQRKPQASMGFHARKGGLKQPYFYSKVDCSWVFGAVNISGIAVNATVKITLIAV
jgi:hypothetical protein